MPAYRKKLKTALVVIVWIALAAPVVAETSLDRILASASEAWGKEFPGDWSHTVAMEGRFFKEKGQFDQEQISSSLSLESSYTHRWNKGRSLLQFTPFFRIDQHDGQRSHWDLREWYWAKRGQGSMIKVGVVQHHWGITEFQPVVNVLNQLDLVEGRSGAALGQPTVQWRFNRTSGQWDFYLLSVNRQRTYPGTEGRLRLPVAVDTENPNYHFGNQAGLDWAVRWKKSFADLTVALSHFEGMNREPQLFFNFDFNQPRLVPNYRMMKQNGMELEWLWNYWSFKLEAIDRYGDTENIEQAKAGVEHTWGAVFGTDMDITGLVEYFWDSREGLTPTFIDHDFLFASRIAFNDLANTQFTLGYLWDDQTKERAATLTFSRAVASDFELRLKARVVFETDPAVFDNDPLDDLGGYIERLQQGEIPDLDESADLLLAAAAFSQFIDTDGGDLEAFVASLAVDQELALLDPNQVVETLRVLRAMGDPYRKLNLFQFDDYLEVELLYHF